MKVKIRQETIKDRRKVFKLIEEAFLHAEYSDHFEHLLVDRLRKSANFIPELSLVAEFNSQIVGYVLLTKISLNTNSDLKFLSLAPVVVLPEFQNKGIGGQLIEHSHIIAKELDFDAIAILGHANYYPRFGYRQASNFGIKFPFDAPGENCFILELNPSSLENIHGTLKYPDEFDIL